MDLYLDPTTHDLVLENGDLKMVKNTEGDSAETRQRVKVTLLTQKGEWLFDTEDGVDWVGEVLVHSPNLDLIAARLRAVTGDVEGVKDVGEISLDLDPTTRELTIQIDLGADGVVDLAVS